MALKSLKNFVGEDYALQLEKKDQVEVMNDCEPEKIVRKYPFPALTSSLPNKVNPLYENPNRSKWIEWVKEVCLLPAERLKLVEEWFQHNAYFYPLCADIHRFELACKWSTLFFVLDDHHDAHRSDLAKNREKSNMIWKQLEMVLERLKNTKFISMTNWKPYTLALYSLSEIVYKDLNEVQRKRFIDYQIDYMQGNMDEIDYASGVKKFKSIDEYIQLRIKTTGGWAGIQIMEFTQQVYIPENIWNDTRIQRLTELYITFGVLVNDIFSFEYELKEKNMILENMINIVAVVSQLEAIPLETSFEKVAKMLESYESEVVHLRDEILSDENCLELTTYWIDLLNHFIGGTFKAHHILEKYQ